MSGRGRSVRLLAAAALTSATAVAGCAPSPATSGASGSMLATVAPRPALVRAAGLDSCPASKGTRANTGLPDLALPCLGRGPAVPLQGLAGTPTVVNVWYTACGPCRTEMPLLQRLHREAGTSLRVLGIDYDDDPDAALGVLKARAVTYPSVMDQNGLLRAALPLRGTPTTLFVDRDGRLVHTKIGEIRGYSELTSLVREHLGVAL